MSMADFKKREFTEINKTAYEITDDFDHTAQLSPPQAYELMQRLSPQGEELFRLTMVCSVTRRRNASASAPIVAS